MAPDRRDRNMRSSSIFEIHRIPWVLRVLIAYTLGPNLNWSPTRIRKALQERGSTIRPSLAAICLLCRRFRNTGNISDKPRSGRPSLLKPGHLKYIDWKIRSNREITLHCIQTKLEVLFKVKVSKEALRKSIIKLGWRKTQTRYCQMISEANRPKRLLFSMLCMARKDQFVDCIFTDEASIELTRGGCLRFRHKDEASIFVKMPKPKHPYKVHVWAGISHRGATPICVFTGLLNAAGLEVILEETLLPFIQEKYPGRHRFLQDNDPKHTSKHIKQFMKTNGVNHWRTPPESPDLNPIEMVWADLKRYLKTKVRPMNKEDLTRGIREYWATLTAAKCQRYIEHLKKVIPTIILLDGSASGY